jgi:hypothetical protein
MKVSIIVATYNSEHGINFCLDSILSQDYKDIECLIIDGNSKDRTLDIVSEIQINNPFVKLFSEPDKGIYDALNKGVSLATGDIIGFVHSDDFLASTNVISEIVSKLLRDNLDGVYGNLQYVAKENINKIVRLWRSNDFSPNLLSKGWMPPHPTLFLKKSVYSDYGCFNLSYKISADYDFILRIFKSLNLKFGFLPLVITKMRVGGASNRNLKNIILKSKEDYNILKNNKVGGILSLIKKNTSKVFQFISH